jgi:hypothetical protein
MSSHRAVVFLTVVAVFVAVGVVSEEALPALETVDSLVADIRALHRLFRDLDGERTWPPSFKHGWTADGDATTACAPGVSWPGVTCQLALRRIVFVNHRSGMAEGELPEEVGWMSALETFDFSENRLTGRVPPFGPLSLQLKSIALAGNRLSGGIPATLGAARTLRFLSLSRNGLVGAIPSALGNCATLEALFLDSNSLSGDVPWEAVFQLTQLRHLRIDGNADLRGTVKASDIVARLPNLLALELAGTGIDLLWDDERLADLHLLTLPTDAYNADESVHYRTLSRESLVTLADGRVESRRIPRGDRDAPLRFMAMGDFGTGGHLLGMGRELASADQFRRAAKWIRPEFTITVGDNMYAPRETLDAFFFSSFEANFDTPELQTPWYPAIGNHDDRAQMEYSARSHRWKFNSVEYVVSAPSRLVDVFVVENLGRKRKYFEYNAQRLRASIDETRTTGNGTARFTISTAHYPPLSSGCHDAYGSAQYWYDVARESKFHALFAGHDHHSEAAVNGGGPNTFLVGAFARGPCVKRDLGVMATFKETVLGGFAYVTVSDQLLNVTFVSQLGHIQAKTSVPFDWPTKNAGRRPTADEIKQYASKEVFGAPSPSSQTSSADSSWSAGDDGITALSPGTKPARQAKPSTTKVENASQPTTTDTVDSPARPLDFASWRKRSHPLTTFGGALWWLTTIVIVALPILVVCAAFADTHASQPSGPEPQNTGAASVV